MSTAKPAGLLLTETKPFNARMSDLSLSTPALKGSTKVRVLLPASYDADATRRYPVLFLLQGCCTDYTSWTREGDAEAIAAKYDLIVVMPDAGKAGFYSDWSNNGQGGQPMWETYHIDQLIPFIDGHYRTIATRSGRAIAGESMGGFGAMSYASRHPQLFVAAAAWSGAVNITGVAGPGYAQLSFLDGGNPTSIWGDRTTNAANWVAHNPLDQAAALKGMTIILGTGNGQPGGKFGGGPDQVEASVYPQMVELHQKLVALGIPHTWDDYGPGAHQWPYWNDQLKKALPLILAAYSA